MSSRVDRLNEAFLSAAMVEAPMLFLEAIDEDGAYSILIDIFY